MNAEPEVALVVVDMLIHEGKRERAKTILQNTTHFSSLQQLKAKVYIGQIYFNEQKVQEARKVALDLLSNKEALGSPIVTRGILDILTFEGPDDPPFSLDVSQMNNILQNLTPAMQQYHLLTDFMRLIKRWAVPVWEQMNIDNHKYNNKKNNSAAERYDGGNHMNLLLHPFILQLAKLEQIQSELFESQFALLRKDILLGQDEGTQNNIQPSADTIASVIAHQTMYNQGT